jgi:hypothetical protein
MVLVLPGRGASFSRAVIPPWRNRFRQRATFSGVKILMDENLPL